jgi:hypothetical protein
MGKYYNTKESVDEYIKLALDHDGKQIIIQLKEFLPAGSDLFVNYHSNTGIRTLFEKGDSILYIGKKKAQG